MKPPIDKKGEVRALTAVDMADAVPFSALPKSLQGKLQTITKRGRPKSAAAKAMISFRLPPDMITDIKASGRGYGARVEAILRDALKNGRL
jgi:uncharacterized protein (DUF4415 family)